ATNGRDYPMMQGIFLVMSIAIVVCNFLAEVLYVILDPRIKTGGVGKNGK
ncbi:MAG TPA: ABC transporter permease subunit, partial [Candidatus Faecousia intestinavium]|nr:ABC transporter permease subunit [Candidatus Faecousia intestinavium]